MEWKQTLFELEPVFVCKTLCPKHLLAPKYGQICSAVIPQNIWTLLKSLTSNLLIIHILLCDNFLTVDI